MLNTLRNASRTVGAKILLLLLVVSFGVWGVSASLLGGSPNSVMTVGNQSINPEEFRFAYQRQLSDISRQFGTRLTTEQAKAFGIESQVFSQLAAGAALDELAQKMDLGLSEDRLARLISEDPAFQSTSGQFDRNLFAERLRSSGLREDDYIKERSKVAVRSQIIDAVAGGFTAPSVLVDALNQYRNEQRDIEYLLLTNANIAPIAAPKEDVLSAWFELNKSRYRAPEFRKFTYVKLEASDIADETSVTEEQIAEFYEKNKAGFSTAGKRTIEQIVFTNKEMAEAAANEIRAGTTTFDQVILDQGKTASDVLLGEFTKDTLPDTMIADAVFNVQRDGGLTPVLDGAFGPVLIRVTGIKPETVQSLDDARDIIRTDIAIASAAEEITNVHDRYEDLRGGGSSLIEAAKELNLKAITVEASDATGVDMNGDAITNLPVPTLITEVFKSEPGTESLPINVGRDGFVWFDVVEVIEDRDRTLDEVRDDVIADWTSEQQRTNLQALAAELQTRAQNGEALSAIAEPMGIAVETKLGLRRLSQDALIGQQVVDTVFSGADGIIGNAADAEGSNRLLFKVTNVNFDAPVDTEMASAEQITAMANASGDDILDQMVNKLQSEYGVTINQELAELSMTAY